MDSIRKPESFEAKEFVDRDFGIGGRGCGVSGGVAEKKGGILHSGRIMMPVTPSRNVGRSVPEIDWLLRPLSISNNPTHHLLDSLSATVRTGANLGNAGQGQVGTPREAALISTHNWGNGITYFKIITLRSRSSARMILFERWFA